MSKKVNKKIIISMNKYGMVYKNKKVNNNYG